MTENKGHTSLYLRVVSALVLAPLVLFAMIYGGMPFLIMIALGLGLSLLEWTRMVNRLPHSALFGFAGLIYIGAGFAAFTYLRLHYPDGAGLALALMLCIWASDIGAYFTGKTIGGPKLAPSISPKKTWAGLIGGVISSAVILVAYALYLGPCLSDLLGFDMAIGEEKSFALMFLLGASITLSGQAGDLIESYFKRQADVKDSGNLIPGHGGILDRIDSLLLAAPVFLGSLMVLGL